MAIRGFGPVRKLIYVKSMPLGIVRSQITQLIAERMGARVIGAAGRVLCSRNEDFGFTSINLPDGRETAV